jgi:hypothetical protein
MILWRGCCSVVVLLIYLYQPEGPLCTDHSIEISKQLSWTILSVDVDVDLE